MTTNPKINGKGCSYQQQSSQSIMSTLTAIGFDDDDDDDIECDEYYENSNDECNDDDNDNDDNDDDDDDDDDCVSKRVCGTRHGGAWRRRKDHKSPRPMDSCPRAKQRRRKLDWI